jgi:hypothetical protein
MQQRQDSNQPTNQAVSAETGRPLHQAGRAFVALALLVALFSQMEVVLVHRADAAAPTLAQTANFQNSRHEHASAMPTVLAPTTSTAQSGPPTPEWASTTLEWARTRFVEAGLEAPNTAVKFIADSNGCGGHFGRYSSERRVIEICLDDSSPRRALRQLVLHELAHAWAHASLTDADRARFVDARGLEAWNHQDDAWERRGTEHAAETLAWGLMDIAVEIHDVGDTSDGALHEAFVLLTNAEPINGGLHPSDDPTPPVATPTKVTR